MKLNILSCVAIAGAIMLSACEKDNYDPPTSTLQGYVLYEGEPVGVRNAGVELELWQHGYDLFQKIPVFVNQDGAYSASLFDGDYKLVVLSGNGPWVEPADSIDVQVRGNTFVDVPVTPFYRIRNQAFNRNQGTVSAEFNVEEILDGRTIDRVSLFVSTTTIVDHRNNVGRAEIRGTALGNLNEKKSISLTLPAEVSEREYVYARLGIQVSGFPEFLYTPVMKLQL